MKLQNVKDLDTFAVKQNELPPHKLMSKQNQILVGPSLNPSRGTDRTQTEAGSQACL